MVREERVELSTFGSGGRRSIQLSYSRRANLPYASARPCSMQIARFHASHPPLTDSACWPPAADGFHTDIEYASDRRNVTSDSARKSKKGRLMAVPLRTHVPTNQLFGGAAGAFVLPAFSPPGGGPPGPPGRRPRWAVFCHLSNCSGVRTAFIWATVSSRMDCILVRRSSCDRVVSPRKSPIFLSRASRMGLTFAFWSLVRSSCWASWSRVGPLIPGGR